MLYKKQKQESTSQMQAPSKRLDENPAVALRSGWMMLAEFNGC
jgi:hypothetical protein